MPRELAFICPLTSGMHARPASALERVCSRFSAAVTITNLRTNASADAKSVLATIAAGIRKGDSCLIRVEGIDGQEAAEALRRFIDCDLAACDAPLPQINAAPQSQSLPLLLRRGDAAPIRARALSPGLGRGIGVAIGRQTLPPAAPGAGLCGDREAEFSRALSAIAALRAEIERRLAGAVAETEREILTAHHSITGDPALRAALQRLILESGQPLLQAIVKTDEELSAPLLGSASQLVRERAEDVHDICLRLFEMAGGPRVAAPAAKMRVPSILLAPGITPAQLLSLDRTHIRALALSDAGPTSHAVILARSFGLPVVAGIGWERLKLLDKTEIIADGDAGLLLSKITPEAERYYRLQTVKHERRARRMRDLLSQPPAQTDTKLEIGANIALAHEAAYAFAQGADGIGLFRTEMLFMDRASPPSEEEQYGAYCRVAQAAGGKPVIIRALDIGGDKPVSYMSINAGANPFLSARGARLYERFPAVIGAQLRAIVRASAWRNVKLLVPMITIPEELRQVRRLVSEIQADLAAAGAAFDASMPIGMMVEVPAAAFAIDAFCAAADFFCIGSNDLVQYLFAADRQNPEVSPLYDPYSPVHLRLLDAVVSAAHQRGKWVGLCGQFAQEAEALGLFCGMGIDEISLDAPRVAESKAQFRSLPPHAACAALLREALALGCGAEVRAALKKFAAASSSMPVIDPELIVPGCAGASKTEIIFEAANLLHVAGRITDPVAFEEAVWRREEVYATALGHGFAVPHCKSRDGLITASSIAVLKPAAPIVWGEGDEAKVAIVIVLAVKEGDDENAHLKIFAQLARKIMHEEFRAALLALNDSHAIAAVMRNALGVSA